MYYEEKYENGSWYYKKYPRDLWMPMDSETLAKSYKRAKDELSKKNAILEMAKKYFSVFVDEFDSEERD